MIRALRLSAPAALLALAGCFSLGPKTPPSLLTLTPAQPLTPGQTTSLRDGQAVAIAIPSAPQAVMTLRVPVQESATAIAYVKDAQWSTPPVRAFRDLLADTVTVRTGRAVIDPRAPVISPGLRLTGRLASFGMDAASSSAVVTFDAVLQRGDKDVQARRFEAKVPVGAIDAASVGPAIDQAANQVAAQVADWVGQ